MKLKDEPPNVGYMESAKEAQRAHYLLGLKLAEGTLSDEEKGAYFRELAARVACRYFLWEFMKNPKG